MQETYPFNWLNPSVRLISMSSIVFSPYSNVIKIEHLECYGCRTRAKGRVEVIVQIIQAKTKQNKIKPTTVEGKKKKKAALGVRMIQSGSLHCSNSSALLLYLLFLHRLNLSYVEGFSSPHIISSTTSKNAFSLCPISQ